MAVRRHETGGSDHRPVTVIDSDVEQQRVVHAGQEDVVSVTPDGMSLVRGIVRMLNMWIGLALLVVESMLAFRLAFALAGANAANGFVEFIYDVTGPLVSPFENIANESISGKSVFEPETVIAMAVYAVAAIIVIAFLSVLTTVPGPSTRVVRREHSAHVDEGAHYDEEI
ncbi:MAG: hypothetical protein WD904_11460 [Dehalococcoidia bacterium]